MVEGETPAWVIAHSYHVAPAALASGSPMWVDFHNVDSVIWQRLSRTAPSPFVRIATTWESERGVGGILERLFAPRMLSGVYADELERLEAYAASHR